MFATFPSYYLLVTSDSMCYATGYTSESANELLSISSSKQDRFEMAHNTILHLKVYFEFPQLELQSSAPSMIKSSMQVLGTH